MTVVDGPGSEDPPVVVPGCLSIDRCGAIPRVARPALRGSSDARADHAQSSRHGQEFQCKGVSNFAAARKRVSGHDEYLLCMRLQASAVLADMGGSRGDGSTE